MKRTRNFNFLYLELGDVLYGSDELERWTTADFILKSCSSEGVYYGLTLSYDSGQNKILVGPGACWADSVYLTTGGTYQSDPVSPNATYSVYALRNTVTEIASDGTNYFYTKSGLGFHVTSLPTFPAGCVTLGQVRISPTNSAQIITDSRVDAIFAPRAFRNAHNYYRYHKHTGQPSKISLTLNVTGVIHPDNLPVIPGNKIEGDPIYLRPQTTPRGLSHIGRVKDLCYFERTACWTKDYIHYYTSPWVENKGAVVYKNGIRIYDGFSLSSSVTRSGNDFGEVKFETPLQPYDRIEVATEFYKVKAYGGPWDPSRRVTVYVNGVKVDNTKYEVYAEEGVIQFLEELFYTDIVHVTIHEEYITDTGLKTHYELDDDFGTISSFLGWRDSYLTECNTGQLDVHFLQASAQSGMNYQLVDYKLPADISEIDETEGCINGTKKRVPDGGANLEPVEPILIGGGGEYGITTFGQSFKATASNVSDVKLFMSAQLENVRNVGMLVGLYEAQNGLPGNFLDLYSGTIDYIPKGGGVCTIRFNPPIPVTVGQYYAFIFEFPDKMVGDESSPVLVYRASEDYPDGMGYYTEVVTGMRPLDVNDYGSNDWWFRIYSSEETVSPPPQNNFSINFPQPPRAVVNPAISFVIDCSGSTKSSPFLNEAGTDDQGLRIDAVKNFIQSFVNTFNAGETDPNKKAVFNIVYFTDLIAGHDLILESTMLSDFVFMYPNNLTSDLTVLNQFLDRLKDPDKWGGDTPLNDSIMYAATNLRMLAGNRKKVIVVLTDGMENKSLNSPEFIIDNYIKGEDDITIYSIAFGSGVMSDQDIDSQARLLSKYGYYYNDISNSSLTSILNSILTSTEWGLTFDRREHDFGKDVYLNNINLTSQLPGNSRITASIYFRSDGEEAWNKLYESVDLSQQTTLAVGRLLRYLRFDFVLRAGSEPLVESFSGTYIVPNTCYLFTKPIPLDAPLQTFSVFERPLCVYNGDAFSVEVRVSPSGQPYWPVCPDLKGRGKAVVPMRLKEKCLYVSNKLFRAKNGPWDGYYIAKVYLNGSMLSSTDYILSAPEGLIRFYRSVYEDDDVRIDIYPDLMFRMAVKLVYAQAEPPLSMDFGCMYTKNRHKANYI